MRDEGREERDGRSVATTVYRILNSAITNNILLITSLIAARSLQASLSARFLWRACA